MNCPECCTGKLFETPRAKILNGIILKCDSCKYSQKDEEIIPELEAKDLTNLDAIEHPSHYGGKDDLYEAIKVIEAWGLGFHLGNVVKYISRAGKKHDRLLEDLKKAQWYLTRQINSIENK